MKMLVTFNVDPSRVTANLHNHRADLFNPDGVVAKEIRLGMHDVYARVSKRLSGLYRGKHRRFIDANANYRDKAAPKVVKAEIRRQLEKERLGRYSLTNVGGVFAFGLGNVEDLDKFTDEVLMSSKKEVRGETPEQRRVFPGRKEHPIWRIIEEGAKAHKIPPINPSGIVMFFSHKRGELVRGKGLKSHPGQKGKHVFRRTEHEIYQSDIKAIHRGIRRGLDAANLKYHGKVVQRRSAK